jgi:hypothetical protein
MSMLGTNLEPMQWLYNHEQCQESSRSGIKIRQKKSPPILHSKIFHLKTDLYSPSKIQWLQTEGSKPLKN